MVAAFPGSAGNNLGRVVVEDQDRRLTRDAREFTVDEFVDDQVAEDGDAGLGESVDEGQKTAGEPRDRRGAGARAVSWSRLSQNP